MRIVSVLQYVTSFPFLKSITISSPAYDVFVSDFIRYARACSKYDGFPDNRQVSYSSMVIIYIYSVRNRYCGSFGRYGDLVKTQKAPFLEWTAAFWPTTQWLERGGWYTNIEKNIIFATLSFIYKKCIIPAFIAYFSVMANNSRFTSPCWSTEEKIRTNWMLINRSCTNLLLNFFLSPDPLNKVSMKRQTHLESSKSSFAKSGLYCCCLMYRHRFRVIARICFAWLRKV